MTIVIRKYQSGDEVEVSDLVRDALRNHKYDFKGTDPKLIEHDISIYTPQYIKGLAARAVLYVAMSDDNDEILGVACLDNGELHSCYTKGEFQNRGVGKALLKRAEYDAKVGGFDKLRVHANFYAEPFYKSCGFQLIKHTTVDFYGAEWPVVYMEKLL